MFKHKDWGSSLAYVFAPVSAMLLLLFYRRRRRRCFCCVLWVPSFRTTIIMYPFRTTRGQREYL